MSKGIIDESKIQELLTRSIEKIFPSREFLEEKLRSGQQISVYLGIDPTGPDLHLGHSVQLLTLKRFQDLGHEAILVIGDFTARIGDPSGRDQRRVPLTERQVKENEKSYKEQAGKILDSKKTKVRHNSEWLGKLKFEEVLKLAAQKTVQQLLGRDMFQKRMEKGDPIGAHEFLYPFMQGYDSVALGVDGELGATDQTFNMLVGRDLEKTYLNKEKFVLTTRLLVNPKTGGKMMSKTGGDYIPLSVSPQEMYSRVMALPDEIVFEMFELCTEVPMGKIKSLKSGDILAAKHSLAYEITKIYHGGDGANFAKEEFSKIFKGNEIPQDIKEIKFGKDRIGIINLLTDSGLVSSASEAKRLVSQGAIEIDGRRISDWEEIVEIKERTVVKIGPRRFFKAVN